MSQPRVSVIIPVYGVERLIERCARSLFEQTLDDIEYLFIDDCTPDHSIDVLKRVLEEYPEREARVIIHRMEHNSGQAAVRKWGIQHAKGEYIIHCDSDDWVDTELYEKLYNQAQRDGADIIAHPFRISDGTERWPLQFFPYADINHITCKLGDWENEGSLCNKLIKADLYKEDIIFPEDNFGEDMCLVSQLIYYARKISVVMGVYYYIYNNSNSITRVQDEDKLYRNFQQGYANCKIVEAFYMRKNALDRDNMKALKRLKYSKRELLRPLLGKRKYYKIWCNTFPELDKNILFDSALTLREKIKSLCIRYHLFPLPWEKNTFKES